MDWFLNMAQEHGLILKVANSMKNYAPKLAAGKEIPNLLSDISDFLVNFADKNHHGKEESALFVILRKKKLPNSRVIDELISEHAQAREEVKAMRFAKSNSEAAAHAVKYAELIARHIVKENAFFAEARRFLTPEDGAKLAEEFSQIEKAALGEWGAINYADSVKKIEGRATQ